jgi:DNA-binding transcriptional ArsR family regulator
MDYKPKIKLSQDEFRVLASSTRIDILKLLDESQYTVSDISRKLDMNKATVHEHLTKLMEVGLVKKDDSPRKWVYYRLTWKGRNLLHPERVRVMVSLGIMLTVIVLGVLIIAAQTDYITPGPGDPDVPPVQETSIHTFWADSGQANVLDIQILSSTALTITSVEELNTYIESGPTEITKRNPVQLDKALESDVIHLYDYSGLLEEHTGKWLYVEGKLRDNRAVERPFNLRKFLAPQGWQVDLQIGPLGINIDTSNLTETGKVKVTFVVENNGNLDANSTLVQVFAVKPTFRASGFPSYGSPYLSMLHNVTEDFVINGTVTISFETYATNLFLRGVMVFVDPCKSMPDDPGDDNTASLELPTEIMEYNEGLDVPEEGEEGAGDWGIVAAVVAAIILVAIVLMAWIFLNKD